MPLYGTRRAHGCHRRRSRRLVTNGGADRRGAPAASTDVASLVNISLRVAERLFYDGRLADALHLIDSNIRILDRDDAPMNRSHRALEIRQAIDDRRGCAEAIIYIGVIHERQGDPDAARSCYQRGLDISARHGFKLEKSYATRHLAFIRAADDDLDGALALFEESLALGEEIGFRIYLPFSYLSVGDVHHHRGDLDAALSYYEKAEALARELDAARARVLCLLGLGNAHLKGEDTEQAARHYRRARTVSESIN